MQDLPLSKGRRPILAMKTAPEETGVLLSRHGGVFPDRYETYNAPPFSSEELLEAFPMMSTSESLVDLAISSMFVMRAVPKDASNMILQLLR